MSTPAELADPKPSSGGKETDEKKKLREQSEQIAEFTDQILKLTSDLHTLGETNITDKATILELNANIVANLKQIDELTTALDAKDKEVEELSAFNNRLTSEFDRFSAFKKVLLDLLNTYAPELDASPAKPGSAVAAAAGSLVNPSYSSPPPSPTKSASNMGTPHSSGFITSESAQFEKDSFEALIINKAKGINEFILEIKKYIEELTKEHGNNQKAKQALEQHIQLLEAQISATAEENKSKLKDHKEAYEKKVKAYKEEADELRGDIDNQRQKFETALSTNIKENAKFNDESREAYESTLRTKQADNDNIIAQLRQKERDLANKTSEITALQTKALEKQKEVDAEKAQHLSAILALQSKEKAANRELKQLSDAVLTTKKVVISLTEKNAQLQTETADLRSTISKMDADKSGSDLVSKNEREQLRRDLAAQQAEHARVLEEAKAAREKELAAAHPAHEHELAEMRATQTKALADEKLKHEKALADEKLKHEKALADEKLKHEKALADALAAQKQQLHAAHTGQFNWLISTTSNSSRKAMEDLNNGLLKDFSKKLDAQRADEENARQVLKAENDALRSQLAALMSASPGLTPAAAIGSTSHASGMGGTHYSPYRAGSAGTVHTPPPAAAKGKGMGSATTAAAAATAGGSGSGPAPGATHATHSGGAAVAVFYQLQNHINGHANAAPPPPPQPLPAAAIVLPIQPAPAPPNALPLQPAPAPAPAPANTIKQIATDPELGRFAYRC